MGSAVIFAGTKVKTLKSTLNLNGLSDVISSTTDPTSVAVSAEPGSLLLNSSNGQLYRKNDSGSSTNWTTLGAGGQAGINYITNPDALTNTTGWSTYADAAGAQPVDGTGGSPSVTFTRSTTSPLRGAADFNFSKDAVNRQGQGASTDFIIDLADQARVLSVSFNYEVLSGTYADGDLTVYLIADPSGTPVVIQPAGYTVMSATTGTKMQLKATFQTQATGQTYRLCIHVASTSASAYSLAIDNVTVGPQVSLTAPVMGDWVNYTPTFNSGFTVGTGGTSVWQYRRTGDTIFIKGAVQFGSTGGSMGTGNFRFSLPSGITVDQNKTGNLFDRIGIAAGYKSPNTTTLGTPNLITTGAGQTSFEVASENSGATAWNATTPVTWAANDYFWLNLSVPIAGWSSNAVSSADSEQRLISAQAACTTAFVTNATTPINFNSVIIDRAGAVTTSATAWKFTAPVSGDYRISLSLITSVGATTAQVFKNGVTFRDLMSFSTVAVTSASTTVTLNAGDYIDIRGASGVTLLASAPTNTVSIERLSGPAVVQATETVAAIYYSTAGNSIANATDVVYVDFPTKVTDTHNAVSNAGGGNKTTQTGAWVFTAPVSGTYSMTASCSIIFPGSITAETFIQGVSALVSLGGSRLNYTVPATGEARAMVTSSLYKLNAGEKLFVGVYQNSGAARNQNNEPRFNSVSIVRVGN